MSQTSSEAHARILIDDLLRGAGWDPADRSQVDTEVWVKHGHEIDFQEPATGRVAEPRVAYRSDGGRLDYELLDTRGRSLAIIEAKREGIDPYTAKRQALPLARKRGAAFIFLSNGDLIYFWDYNHADARQVDSFFSRRDLERIRDMRQDRKPLATIPIPDSYFRRGKAFDVRNYQKEAMRSLDHALELGKRKFLLQLPTGCGKTDLITLYLKRLFQAGMAERVLFLVDRENLAKQAIECLQDVLGGQYGSYWLRAGMQPEQQQITVCLLQTMVNQYRSFTSGYFDVVIADECHRSIYGSWQTALTHFDALHVGLTATPSEYIERNTFRFYQCKNETPDFPYSLTQAIDEKHLVPYSFCKGITRIIAEGVDWEDEHLDPFEFERRYTNEDTNRKMMQEFDAEAWAIYKEVAPLQKVGPGKTIVYALTKNHAARLARYLNELHPEVKTRTGEDYAAVITSDVPDADALIRKFKREDYPQIAVSVGMLDTGFDCPEVLHLVLCRFVRSPILYQQMRGRGTRKADHIGKKMFVIYDFFGNHEYFGDSDTAVFEGTGRGHAPGPPQVKPHEARELIELGIEDEWLIRGQWVEVGPDGERIDRRDYISNWEKTIQAQAEAHPLISKVKQDEPLTAEEEDQLGDELNRPDKYFNEDNLRRAYQLHEGNLIDFIKHALRDKLGRSPFKTPEERVNEDFRAWLVAQRLDPEQAQYLNLVKNRFIANGSASVEDLFRPPLSLLNAANVGIQLFGEDRLKTMIEDMNYQVFKQREAA